MTEVDTHPHSSHAPTHQRFRWSSAEAQRVPSSFVETAFDISTGLNTCLEIIYASHLERLANSDADPGESAPPAIGEMEAEHLMRLSIAASALLRDDARRQLEMAEQDYLRGKEG